MYLDKFEDFYTSIEREMFSFFKELVETNSYSYNSEGISKCLDIFQSKSNNFLSSERVGNNCLLLSNGVFETEYVLLMGHIDTIFPENTNFTDFVVKENIITGPGTFDMKGGLVVALYALKFLDFIGELKKIKVKFLINSDEEIGSLKSKNIIQQNAISAKCALVFEGGSTGGEVVVGRKGKLGLKASTLGEAGHAAFKIDGKKSAILEMAHKVIELENINDTKKNISCNVGTIKGGVGANTIPEKCEVSIDIRYTCNEDFKAISNKINNIALSNFVEGVRFEMTKTSERPCMEKEKNQKFFDFLSNRLGKYGLSLKPEFRNGVSDANFISDVGTEVLDGFGPIGGNDHSNKEFIYKDSMKDRIYLTALSLLELI